MKKAKIQKKKMMIHMLQEMHMRKTMMKTLEQNIQIRIKKMMMKKKKRKKKMMMKCKMKNKVFKQVSLTIENIFAIYRFSNFELIFFKYYCL